MATDPKTSPAKPKVARKPTAARPRMVDRIVEAIKAQPPSTKGVPIVTIKNYMVQHYGMENNATLKNSLRKGIVEGETNELFFRPKGSEATGLKGRFKLNKAKIASIEKAKNKKTQLMAKRAEIKEKASKAKTTTTKKTDKPKSPAEKPKVKTVKEKKSPKKTTKKPAAKKATEAKPPKKAAAKKSPAKKSPKKAAEKKPKKAAPKPPSTPREKLKATKSKKGRA